MRIALLLIAAFILAACGSKGPPVPDWKTDSANYIDRYKKAYLAGENTLADRHFERALNATSGAGKVVETARLWLIQCAVHKASRVTDACGHYAELANIATTAEDAAYAQFLSGQWNRLDEKALPSHYLPIIKAASGEIAQTNQALAAIADPLALLIGAGVLLERKQADDATLELAARTASDQGWRRPLLVYLKLQESRATERGDTSAKERLVVQIGLVEAALAQP
jgi:hypothetical protein